jgi:hypothetical protein
MPPRISLNIDLTLCVNAPYGSIYISWQLTRFPHLTSFLDPHCTFLPSFERDLFLTSHQEPIDPPPFVGASLFLGAKFPPNVKN